MPGRENQWKKLAKDAVDRVERDRDLQHQLSLLPDEVADGDPAEPRKVRGKGKVLSQMREFLASKGYRFPEEQLAEIAGLSQQGDSLEVAMAQAERILAWSMAGAAPEKRDGVWVQPEATLGQRLTTLQQVRTAQLRAAEALLPYGAPKASPDEAPQLTVQVAVPAAPTQAVEPRDVTPQPAKIASRMRPANVRWENQQNQQVSDTQSDASDSESRTK